MASSADNAVYQIPNAATAASTQTASLLFSDFTHLHGPLDIGFLPNGHLLVANSDGSNVDPNQPSELVEFTRTGTFVGQFSVDSDPAAPFGIALSFSNTQISLAAVNDDTNMLRIYTLTKTTEPYKDFIS